MSYSSSFQFCFDTVVAIEAGFTNTSSDPGNWTGGKIGSGQLKGTKYGISAASYPNLDIANLTLAQAEQIYYNDYWLPIQGDKLAEPVALIVFDGAINQGTKTAVKALQSAIGTFVDGNLGPITLTTIETFTKFYGGQYLCSLILRARLFSYMQDSNFGTFKNAWTQRLFNISLTAGQFLNLPRNS
jgi:lysozyme family protein